MSFLVLFLCPLLLLFDSFFFFFFNDTATTEIYTLSLHDALPIWAVSAIARRAPSRGRGRAPSAAPPSPACNTRSEEHTSELQSLRHLVCRLLLEKKKKKNTVRAEQKKNIEKTQTTKTR